MVTIKKLDTLLTGKLKGYRSGLGKNHDRTMILGYVVSSDFSQIDHHKRQKKLMKILESALTEKDLKILGPIITLSPAEADVGKNAA